MAKSLSIDLGERMIAVIDGGLSRRRAAARGRCVEREPLAFTQAIIVEAVASDLPAE